MFIDNRFSRLWFPFRSLNFGKFKETEYPLQVWEPEDEAEFHKISGSYLNYVERSKRPHKGEFRFAINIDPAMFMVHHHSCTAILSQNRHFPSQNLIYYLKLLFGCQFDLRVFFALTPSPAQTYTAPITGKGYHTAIAESGSRPRVVFTKPNIINLLRETNSSFEYSSFTVDFLWDNPRPLVSRSSSSLLSIA